MHLHCAQTRNSSPLFLFTRHFTMKFTSIIAFLALSAAAVSALPGMAGRGRIFSCCWAFSCRAGVKCWLRLFSINHPLTLSLSLNLSSSPCSRREHTRPALSPCGLRQPGQGHSQCAHADRARAPQPRRRVQPRGPKPATQTDFQSCPERPRHHHFRDQGRGR